MCVRCRCGSCWCQQQPRPEPAAGASSRRCKNQRHPVCRSHLAAPPTLSRRRRRLIGSRAGAVRHASARRRAAAPARLDTRARGAGCARGAAGAGGVRRRPARSGRGVGCGACWTDLCWPPWCTLRSRMRGMSRGAGRLLRIGNAEGHAGDGIEEEECDVRGWVESAGDRRM